MHIYVNSNVERINQNDTIFDFTLSHRESFDKIKTSITTDQDLSHYDQRKPYVFHVDASLKELKELFTQNSKPICFVSEFLTATEK